VSQSSYSAAPSASVIRFGRFEADLRTLELRKDGVKVKLQNQPFQILQMLLEHPGEVVTREDIRKRIWPADTFVDYEHSVNTAIKKLRQALDDRSEHPSFIETIPRMGFRFIGTIDAPAKTEAPIPAREPIHPARRGTGFILGAVVLAACVIGTVVFLRTKGIWPAKIRSIAVLPLVNLSSDPQQEYFGEGMTSELTTALARFDGLQVTSHTSVRRYRDPKRPLPEIARELGVDAVIEGTVMRSGNHVRITVQLIDARSDRHVWAESYDSDVRDILSLQAELAQKIATEVGIHLTASEQARLASNRMVDPAAHEAYLKGAFYWNRLNCAGFRQGLEYYQEAVSKDPRYALAWAGVGDSYFILADWGCMPQQEAFAKSKSAALKAVELDPGSSETHTNLGELAFYYEWDWARADREYNQAIALDTNDASAHAAYAIYLTAMGRPEQGLAEIKKAEQLDPVSEITNITFVYVDYLAHQYDQAVAQTKRTLELFPQSGAAYYWLGQCYERQRKEQEALAAYLGPPPANGKAPAVPASLRDFWQQKFDQQGDGKSEPGCLQIQTSTHLGNKEKTLDLLEWGYQHHCDGLQFLKVEPIYDNLRGDPRYRKLLSRLGL